MANEREANEDVFRRMRASGDDLSIPRNVDFVVAFPVEDSANQFAEHFRDLGYSVSVELTNTEESLPWDVVVVRHMAPSDSGIAEFEIVLEMVALPLSGRNAGWGCFSQP